jgi:hypothetical protein
MPVNQEPSNLLRPLQVDKTFHPGWLQNFLNLSADTVTGVMRKVIDGGFDEEVRQWASYALPLKKDKDRDALFNGTKHPDTGASRLSLELLKLRLKDFAQ